MNEFGRAKDSTRGMAKVDPVTYKGDALVQVWVDSRVLATLSNWLDSEGMVTRYLSEVVKGSLQILCDHLEDSGAVSLVDDTTTARTLLERKYRVNLNPEGRGKRNVLHNIILSQKRQGLGGQIKARSEAINVNDASYDFGRPKLDVSTSIEDLAEAGKAMLAKIKEKEND